MQDEIGAAAGVQSRVKSRFGSAVLILTGTLFAFATAALAQEDAKVRAGLEAWKTAGCPECHGAFADGERQRDEAPRGANLRQTRLDNAALHETIRCGRPGTGMPKFGADAYTPRGCYGKPAEPPPAALYPGARDLSAEELDAVVAYLRARVVGKRAVTREECVFYYGDLADSFCDPAL
jgi:mono/diheme cytochrome c family protein